MERNPVAWNAVDRAEAILQASGAAISHGGGNRAFYRLTTDTIHLPDKSQFESADRYYATDFRTGHWTGHQSRLARDLGHPFGSEAYAREELRAEIASMILGDELGIGHDPDTPRMWRAGSSSLKMTRWECSGLRPPLRKSRSSSWAWKKTRREQGVRETCDV